MNSLPYPGKAQCPYPPPPPFPGHPVAKVTGVGTHELLDPGDPVAAARVMEAIFVPINDVRASFMIDARYQRLEIPRCNEACSVIDFRCESRAATIFNNVSWFEL